MEIKKKYMIVMTFLFFLSYHVSSQVIIPTNPELLEIRNEINRMVEDSLIPSLGVAVIKDGKVIWKEAIGYANIENNEKATIHSIYPLGSIAKSITATGIMEMVNNQKLSLYGNVQEYLNPIKIRNISGETPIVPLWQLISQNAGINHGYGVFLKSELPKTENEISKFIEHSTIIAFEPGTNYHYSNHSFDLSEIIIKKKSGQAFESYMSEYVFKPLGMIETYAYPYKHPDANFVKTYTSKMNAINDKTITFPAGGSSWWSSIYDLTKYVQFHMGILNNEKIISKNNLKLMHEFRQGPADLFGIGWFNDNKNQTLYSNGNVGGGNASILIDKKNNIGIVTLLNRTSWDGIADQVNGKINKILNPDFQNQNFEIWQRIYGTSYNVRIDLIGTWTGIIKEPVTEKEIPFQLNFDEHGSVTIEIKNQEVKLENLIYNLKGNFTGEFKAILPSIYEKETNCVLNLNRDKNIFNGYIQYDNDSDEKFYTMPLFVKVNKEI